MKKEQLEIVNENDEVIGLESRELIHQKGLLHREIHVWFMTPNREIIFQHRAKDKDTYPDKLDATVGGHVEPSMSYEETAIKESKEETSIDLDPNKLKLVTKIHKKTFDEATGLINNSIRSQYAYLFEGDFGSLQVETGKAIGFEAWKIDLLPSLSEQDRNRFIPIILSEEFIALFERCQKILNLK